MLTIMQEVSPSTNINCICVIDADIEVEIIAMLDNQHLTSSKKSNHDEVDEDSRLEEQKFHEVESFHDNLI